MTRPSSIALAGLLFSTSFALQAADSPFTLKKTESGGFEVSVNGKPFTTYVVDQANKTYLAPVFGPTGKSMTRAFPMQNVEGEQHDHPHHRGICFGHEHTGVDGAWTDTWAEKLTYEGEAKNAKQAAGNKDHIAKLGTIKHREYTEMKTDADKAVVAEICDHLDPSGKRMLTEERRMTFRLIGEMRAIDFDQDLIASEGPVTLDDSKDAGLSIRVPTSMAVDTQKGGHIITSEGLTDVAAWSKSAKWVDYNGPVEGEQLGVAMLNHPTSFHYPTRWHVRSYGLFTANPFASRAFDKALPETPTEIKKGDRLKLRHRFIFHTGDEKAAKIAEAFAAYEKEAK